MNRARWLFLLLSGVLFACSADGGPVGTGVSAVTSSISGNVIDVQAASSLTTAADTAAVTVGVSIDEVPSARTTTDSDGNFQLSGDFSGNLTLRFTVPQFQVTQPVDVPSGSAIVLQDIELAPGSVQAQAARQLNFQGRVAVVDCTQGTLVIGDDHSMEMQFRVQLNDQTIITGANGMELSCADIHEGDNVAVEGTIQLQSDHMIVATMVTLGPPPMRGGPPPETEDVRVDGAIAVLDCNDGFIVIDNGNGQRSRLQIAGNTEIDQSDGASLQCSDLNLGDEVEAEGNIDLRTPGTIDATEITRQTESSPGTPVRFFGFVTAIDCDSGVLDLSDVSGPIVIHLLSTTTITDKRNNPAECIDIQLGDRIAGVAETTTTFGDINAVSIVDSHRGGPGGPQGDMH